MIGVDAAEVLDATMARHCIERMTIIRTWDDDRDAHVWTVRVAGPFGGLVAAHFGAFVAQSGPHEQLTDAMVDAARALADARCEAAQK